MLSIYGKMHSTVSVMRQMQFAELQLQQQQQRQQQQLVTSFAYGITLFVCVHIVDMVVRVWQGSSLVHSGTCIKQIR